MTKQNLFIHEKMQMLSRKKVTINLKMILEIVMYCDE